MEMAGIMALIVSAAPYTSKGILELQNLKAIEITKSEKIQKMVIHERVSSEIKSGVSFLSTFKFVIILSLS
jgi:hypothetical protein